VDSEALRAYSIYPYLIAARLQAALGGRTDRGPDPELDTHIAAFIQEHRGEPVTRVLLHDWLESLAVRQQWGAFLAHVSDYPPFLDDPLLVCEQLKARLAIEAASGSSGSNTSADPAIDDAGGTKSDFVSAALTVWSAPTKQPAACDDAFGWLQRQGLLTDERVEQRARAALAAGNGSLALKLAAGLPEAQAAPLLGWAALLLRPQARLEAMAQMPTMPVEPQALTAGIGKLSLSDSVAAKTVLPALLMRPDMTPDLAGQLQRMVALGLAYDHAAGAAEALEGVPEAARDDKVREWGARVALWAGDWPRALGWLDGLSPAAAAEPRWRYWRARALATVAGDAAARPLFESLAGLRDFYGYLAADRIGRPYDVQAHPTPADPTVQSTLAARLGLIRAHELFACGLTASAELEWAVALQGASNAERVQAAQLASAWGWSSQAIAQLARVGDLDDVALRYPRPYADLVTRASALTNVPSDWLFAVIRQESWFDARSVSRANAQGLMQLLPATAAGVAQRWHVTLNRSEDLFDPVTSVTLGAARLRELLDQYDGALVLTLAAYNAGAAPVARWLPPQSMDADVWIENISYGETRDYVQRILEHIVAYCWVRGAELPRISTLMPAIDPATPTIPTTGRSLSLSSQVHVD
jgi:soluble lytic murein transglycosylase